MRTTLTEIRHDPDHFFFVGEEYFRAEAFGGEVIPRENMVLDPRSFFRTDHQVQGDDEIRAVFVRRVQLVEVRTVKNKIP